MPRDRLLSHLPVLAVVVTGGGTIDVDVMGGIGNFHFIVQRQADTGELSGRLLSQRDGR